VKKKNSRQQFTQKHTKNLRAELLALLDRSNMYLQPERRVPFATAVEVANRDLRKTRNSDPDARVFSALRAVSSFMSLSAKNKVTTSALSNADLLPVGHPMSRKRHAMTASALRHARAKWIAADELVDDSARELVIIAHAADPGSIERIHAFARLMALGPRFVPITAAIDAEPLNPITAAFGFGVGGNSKAARSARAKLQRRDRKGRFAEMGGGFMFNLRMPDKSVGSLSGRVVGASGEEDIEIEVKDHSSVPNGIYAIPSSKGNVIKGVLSQEALKDANLPQGREKLDIVGNEDAIEFNDLVRQDAPTGWAKQATAAGEPEIFTSEDGYFVKKDGDNLSLHRADLTDNSIGDEVVRANSWADIVKGATADQDDYEKVLEAADAAEKAGAPAPEAAPAAGPAKRTKQRLESARKGGVDYGSMTDAEIAEMAKAESDEYYKGGVFRVVQPQIPKGGYKTSKGNWKEYDEPVGPPTKEFIFGPEADAIREQFAKERTETLSQLRDAVNSGEIENIPAVSDLTDEDVTTQARRAKNAKQKLRFNYNGKDREITPTETYRNNKTGKNNIVGLDENGETRTFTTDKMSPPNKKSEQPVKKATLEEVAPEAPELSDVVDFTKGAGDPRPEKERNEIEAAINAGQKLRVNYSGKDRVIEPLRIWTNPKNEQENVTAIDHTDGGKEKNFNLLKIEKPTAAKSTDEFLKKIKDDYDRKTKEAKARLEDKSLEDILDDNVRMGGPVNISPDDPTISLQEQMQNAIDNGETVRFNYSGKERVFTPENIYKNPKNGNVNVRGTDDSGESKTFTLDKIEEPSKAKPRKKLSGMGHIDKITKAFQDIFKTPYNGEPRRKNKIKLINAIDNAHAEGAISDEERDAMLVHLNDPAENSVVDNDALANSAFLKALRERRSKAEKERVDKETAEKVAREGRELGPNELNVKNRTTADLRRSLKKESERADGNKELIKAISEELDVREEEREERLKKDLAKPENWKWDKDTSKFVYIGPDRNFPGDTPSDRRWYTPPQPPKRVAKKVKDSPGYSDWAFSLRRFGLQPTLPDFNADPEATDDEDFYDEEGNINEKGRKENERRDRMWERNEKAQKNRKNWKWEPTSFGGTSGYWKYVGPPLDFTPTQPGFLPFGNEDDNGLPWSYLPGPSYNPPPYVIIDQKGPNKYADGSDKPKVDLPSVKVWNGTQKELDEVLDGNSLIAKPAIGEPPTGGPSAPGGPGGVPRFTGLDFVQQGEYDGESVDISWEDTGDFNYKLTAVNDDGDVVETMASEDFPSRREFADAIKDAFGQDVYDSIVLDGGGPGEPPTGGPSAPTGGPGDVPREDIFWDPDNGVYTNADGDPLSADQLDRAGIDSTLRDAPEDGIEILEEAVRFGKARDSARDELTKKVDETYSYEMRGEDFSDYIDEVIDEGPFDVDEKREIRKAFNQFLTEADEAERDNEDEDESSEAIEDAASDFRSKLQGIVDGTYPPRGPGEPPTGGPGEPPTGGPSAPRNKLQEVYNLVEQAQTIANGMVDSGDFDAANAAEVNGLLSRADDLYSEFVNEVDGYSGYGTETFESLRDSFADAAGAESVNDIPDFDDALSDITRDLTSFDEGDFGPGEPPTGGPGEPPTGGPGGQGRETFDVALIEPELFIEQINKSEIDVRLVDTGEKDFQDSPIYRMSVPSDQVEDLADTLGLIDGDELRTVYAADSSIDIEPQGEDDFDSFVSQEFDSTYDVPDGAYKPNIFSYYEPKGRQEGNSARYTDDPTSLATELDQDELVVALAQAVLPMGNNEASGFGPVNFGDGDEQVPAEALYEALDYQGADAALILAKIYDSMMDPNRGETNVDRYNENNADQKLAEASKAVSTTLSKNLSPDEEARQRNKQASTPSNARILLDEMADYEETNESILDIAKTLRDLQQADSGAASKEAELNKLIFNREAVENIVRDRIDLALSEDPADQEAFNALWGMLMSIDGGSSDVNDIVASSIRKAVYNAIEEKVGNTRASAIYDEFNAKYGGFVEFVNGKMDIINGDADLDSGSSAAGFLRLMKAASAPNEEELQRSFGISHMNPELLEKYTTVGSVISIDPRPFATKRYSEDIGTIWGSQWAPKDPKDHQIVIVAEPGALDSISAVGVSWFDMEQEHLAHGDFEVVEVTRVPQAPGRADAFVIRIKRADTSVEDMAAAQAIGEAQALEAPAPPSGPPVPPRKIYDVSGWKRVAEKETGSNEGAFFEDENGQGYYVKVPQSQSHAENEVLAAAFYEAFGAPAAEINIGSKNGSTRIVSKLIPNAKQDLRRRVLDGDEEFLDGLREHFVVDAWLSNWDVTGTNFENVMSDENGRPVRIDPGGSLKWRAQGQPKGGAFGSEVGELDTLRDPDRNSFAGAVFGSMTDEDLLPGAKMVRDMSPSKIDQIVDSVVTDPEEAEFLKERLKARRQNLMERFGLDEIDETPIFTEPVPLTESMGTPAQDLLPGDVTANDSFTIERVFTDENTPKGKVSVEGYYPGHETQRKEWNQETIIDSVRGGETPPKGDKPALHRPKKPYAPTAPAVSGALAQELQGAQSWAEIRDIIGDREIIFFDYETTGIGNGSNNVPVQLGAVKVRNGEVVDRFNLFMDPREPLSEWSKINLLDADGNPLTDEHLTQQMGLEEAHAQFADWMGESPIIAAHNLPFDREILERINAQGNIDVSPAGYIDTLRMGRDLVKKKTKKNPEGTEGHKLGQLLDHYGIEIQNWHSADADAQSAGDLFNSMLNDAADRPDIDPASLDFAAQDRNYSDAKAAHDEAVKKYEEELAQYNMDKAIAAAWNCGGGGGGGIIAAAEENGNSSCNVPPIDEIIENSKVKPGELSDPESITSGDPKSDENPYDGGTGDDTLDQIIDQYPIDNQDFPPTAQQQAIINAVLSNENADTVVRAAAGSGKTSTLVALAKRFQKYKPDKKIIYIAFNRSVADEAREKMPSNVEVRTADSISWNWVKINFPELLKKQGNPDRLVKPSDIIAHLGIPSVGTGENKVTSAQMLKEIRQALYEFTISLDKEIGLQHFDNTELSRDQVTPEVLEAIQRWWSDIQDPKGKMSFEFNHMKKLWSLSEPDLSDPSSGLKDGADVVFVDEFQDTNDVLGTVLVNQPNTQNVYVGDENQAIYQFMGANDWLQKVVVEFDLPITQSFRFGPTIARQGNRFLRFKERFLGSKKTFSVEGAGKTEGTLVSPYSMKDSDVILVRSNAGAFKDVRREIMEGRVVGVTKGFKKDIDDFIAAVEWLQGNPATRGKRPARMPEDLRQFDSWQKVVDEAEDENNEFSSKLQLLITDVEELGFDEIKDLSRQIKVITGAGNKKDIEGIPSLPDDLSVGTADVNGIGKGIGFEVVDDGIIITGKTYDVKDKVKSSNSGVKWDKARGGWFIPSSVDDASIKQKLEKLQNALFTAAEKQSGKVDVVVTTVHQAKGLEWPNVRMGNDFFGPRKRKGVEDAQPGNPLGWIMPSEAEIHLAYVAVTRAEDTLDLGSLSWINGWVSDEDPEVNPDYAPEVSEEVAVAESTDTPDIDRSDEEPNISEAPAEIVEDAPAAEPAAPDTGIMYSNLGEAPTEAAKANDLDTVLSEVDAAAGDILEEGSLVVKKPSKKKAVAEAYDKFKKVISELKNGDITEAEAIDRLNEIIDSVPEGAGEEGDYLGAFADFMIDVRSILDGTYYQRPSGPNLPPLGSPRGYSKNGKFLTIGKVVRDKWGYKGIVDRYAKSEWINVYIKHTGSGKIYSKNTQLLTTIEEGDDDRDWAYIPGMNLGKLPENWREISTPDEIAQIEEAFATGNKAKAAEAKAAKKEGVKLPTAPETPQAPETSAPKTVNDIVSEIKDASGGNKQVAADLLNQYAQSMGLTPAIVDLLKDFLGINDDGPDGGGGGVAPSAPKPSGGGDGGAAAKYTQADAQQAADRVNESIRDSGNEDFASATSQSFLQKLSAEVKNAEPNDKTVTVKLDSEVDIGIEDAKALLSYYAGESYFPKGEAPQGAPKAPKTEEALTTEDLSLVQDKVDPKFLDPQKSPQKDDGDELVSARELMELPAENTYGLSLLNSESEEYLNNQRQSNAYGMNQRVRSEGVFTPIIVREWKDGTRSIYDGHHRLIAAFDNNPDFQVPVVIEKVDSNFEDEFPSVKSKEASTPAVFATEESDIKADDIEPEWQTMPAPKDPVQLSDDFFNSYRDEEFGIDLDSTTDEDVEAAYGLLEYQNTRYDDVNTRLRTGGASDSVLDSETAKQFEKEWKKETIEITESMDKLFDAAPTLVEDIMLYRGVHSEYSDELMRSYEVGDMFTDLGFSSTTLSRGQAEDFTDYGEDSYDEDTEKPRLLLEIIAPEGTRAIHVPAYLGSSTTHPDEDEVLLDRGTTFRVISKTESADGTTKVMRVAVVNQDRKIKPPEPVEEPKAEEPKKTKKVNPLTTDVNTFGKIPLVAYDNPDVDNDSPVFYDSPEAILQLKQSVKRGHSLIAIYDGYQSQIQISAIFWDEEQQEYMLTTDVSSEQIRLSDLGMISTVDPGDAENMLNQPYTTAGEADDDAINAGRVIMQLLSAGEFEKAGKLAGKVSAATKERRAASEERAKKLSQDGEFSEAAYEGKEGQALLSSMSRMTRLYGFEKGTRVQGYFDRQEDPEAAREAYKKGVLAGDPELDVTPTGAKKVEIAEPKTYEESAFPGVQSLRGALSKLLERSDKLPSNRWFKKSKARPKDAPRPFESTALDSGDIEDLEVRANIIRDGKTGERKIRLKFKLTAWAAAEQARKAMNGENDWQTSERVDIPKPRIDENGDLVYTGEYVVSFESQIYKQARTFTKTLGSENRQTKISLIRGVGDDKLDDYGTDNAPLMAFHNYVEVFLPLDATDEEIADALRASGVSDPRPAEPEDVKILAENRLLSVFAAQTDASVNEQDPRIRKAKLRKIEQDWDLTPYDVKLVTDAGGFLTYKIPEESAEKIVEATGVGVLDHQFSHSNIGFYLASVIPDFYNKSLEENEAAYAEYLAGIITGDTAGLTATVHRFTEGAAAPGQSSNEDIISGSAMYVYTSPRDKNVPPRTWGEHEYHLFYDPRKAYQRVDFYANYSDDWGKRAKARDVIDAARAGNYEVMFKHGLSIEDAGFLLVGPETRKRILGILKDRGITEIAGKPVEKFVTDYADVTAMSGGEQNYGISIKEMMYDRDYEGIGRDQFNEAADALTELLGEKVLEHLPLGNLTVVAMTSKGTLVARDEANGSYWHFDQKAKDPFGTSSSGSSIPISVGEMPLLFSNIKTSLDAMEDASIYDGSVFAWPGQYGTSAYMPVGKFGKYVSPEKDIALIREAVATQGTIQAARMILLKMLNSHGYKRSDFNEQLKELLEEYPNLREALKYVLYNTL
jgi:superfamily I DNA/RNA helicase/DNA polymerase III epsilon subunit-like protein